MSINSKGGRTAIISLVVLVIAVVVFIAMSKFSTEAAAWIGPGTYTIVDGVPTGNVTAPVRFADNGNVGIGTSPAAAYKLDVNGSMKIGSVGTTNGNSLVVMAGSGTNPEMFYIQGQNGTNLIKIYATRSVASADTGMQFITSKVLGGPSIALTLTKDGYAGIGTATPAARLTVAGDGTGTANIGGGFCGSTDYTGFSLNGLTGGGASCPNYNLLSGVTDKNLYINRPAGYGVYIRENNSGGIYLTSGATAWAVSSDRRLKENINYDFPGLSIIGQLKPVSFDYINGGKDKVGFIAQEVQGVLPNIVTTDVDGMLGVQTDSMIPYLVKSIQEQQAQIDELKKEIEVLKNK